MVFSSITFLTLFLPFTILGYYACNFIICSKCRPAVKCLCANLFLVMTSFVFYFWGEGWRVCVLAASCIVNFLLARMIYWQMASPEENEGRRVHHFGCTDQLYPGGSRSKTQKLLLFIAIALNLICLFYFKYFNFFIDTIAGAFPPGSELRTWAGIALPLGISFFTFEAISYIIDVYRGDVPAEKNIINFACYLTMFQHLVAGPVIRYRDLYHQLARRSLSRSQFASGARRFIVGLSKKVLIANSLSVIADKAFELPPNQLTTVTAWLGIICYTLQIYYDFSGYSDMAIGLARMFGFEFLENFNYPYIARSAQDFWRRWHISLSTWFRDYLYIPLGGNRKGPLRVYFNLLFVFFLCGLWHGASWVFVAWGLYHGLFLTLERMLIRSRKKGKVSSLGWRCILSLLGHGYAILMVMLGWVLFRSETFAQAWGYYGALLGKSEGSGGANAIWAYYFGLDVKIAVGAGILFSFPILPVLAQWWKERLLVYLVSARPAEKFICLCMELGQTFILLSLLLLCFLPLASGTHNPFIYFRF